MNFVLLICCPWLLHESAGCLQGKEEKNRTWFYNHKEREKNFVCQHILDCVFFLRNSEMRRELYPSCVNQLYEQLT